MKTLIKNDVIDACIHELRLKLMALETEQNEGQMDAAAQAKSTAGDKHDTATAMAHLAQEQSSQLHRVLTQQLQIFLQPQWRKNLQTICPGSLIQTDKGYFLLLHAIGKITCQNIPIMTMSIASPMGQALMGKTAGACIQTGQISLQILNVE
jgi:hypothetical protein